MQEVGHYQNEKFYIFGWNERKFTEYSASEVYKKVDIDDMAIDYQQSLEERLVKQLSLLETKAEFFAEAKKMMMK